MSTGVVLVVAVALAVTACSNDDGAVSTIPTPPTSSPPLTTATNGNPTSTTTNTSIASTTSPHTPTTGTAPTTTVTPTTEGQDLAALRKEVATDWLRASNRLSAFAQAPTRDRMDKVLESVFIRESEGFDGYEDIYRRMITRRERVVLGRPRVEVNRVEEVRPVGDAPFSAVVVTSCEVNNVGLVRETPAGDRLVIEPEGVVATRVEHPMRLTDDGWKQYKFVETTIGRWEGQRKCEQQ